MVLGYFWRDAKVIRLKNGAREKVDYAGAGKANNR